MKLLTIISLFGLISSANAATRYILWNQILGGSVPLVKVYDIGLGTGDGSVPVRHRNGFNGSYYVTGVTHKYSQDGSSRNIRAVQPYTYIEQTGVGTSTGAATGDVTITVGVALPATQAEIDDHVLKIYTSGVGLNGVVKTCQLRGVITYSDGSAESRTWNVVVRDGLTSVSDGGSRDQAATMTSIALAESGGQQMVCN